MNQYLDLICRQSAMVKEAEAETKSELRDTAVIGAVGTGTSLLTNHISNKMGLNGTIKKVSKKVKPTSLASKISKFVKNPGPVLKSPGFRNTLKIGALGGTVGLIGDYAAVKINKSLEKKASENTYLEKIAEMYLYTETKE